ncbi:15065_t:CDS:1, partial [Racocetra fulgida]
LYAEQVYSAEDLYIDPKVSVDNTDSLDNQEALVDDDEISGIENSDSDDVDFDTLKLPAEILEDEFYTFEGFD